MASVVLGPIGLRCGSSHCLAVSQQVAQRCFGSKDLRKINIKTGAQKS